MKRIVYLLIFSAAVLAFASCDKSSNSTPKASKNSKTATTVGSRKSSMQAANNIPAQATVQEPLLLGKWEDGDDAASVLFEFKDGGKGVMLTNNRENVEGKVYQTSVHVNFTYTVSADKLLTITLDFGSLDYDLYISGAQADEINALKARLDPIYKSAEGKNAMMQEMGGNTKELKIKSIDEEQLVLTDVAVNEDETFRRTK